MLYFHYADDFKLKMKGKDAKLFGFKIVKNRRSQGNPQQKHNNIVKSNIDDFVEGLLYDISDEDSKKFLDSREIEKIDVSVTKSDGTKTNAFTFRAKPEFTFSKTRQKTDADSDTNLTGQLLGADKGVNAQRSRTSGKIMEKKYIMSYNNFLNEEITDKKIWYFAYGSNMSRHRLENERGVTVHEVRPGSLIDWKLKFNVFHPENPTTAAANIVKSQDSFVKGVCFKISESDVFKINSSEGFPHHYDKIELSVISKTKDDIEEIQVLSYHGQKERVNNNELPVLDKYWEYLEDGEKYIGSAYLKRIKPKNIIKSC